VHPLKSEFGLQEVTFLGCSLSEKGIAVDKGRVKDILHLRPAATRKELRSLVGVLNFCRSFVANFASLARPLTDMLADSIDFAWGTEQQSALDKLKHAISTSPHLAMFDPRLHTIIRTDASEIGIGATLSQIDRRGEERPIAFLSHPIKNPNMANLERELWAIVLAFERFRPLIGSTFVTVQTDCSGLTGAHLDSMSSKVQRWILKLREQPHTLMHIPGTANDAADGLSRLLHASKNRIAMLIAHQEEEEEEEEHTALITTRSKTRPARHPDTRRTWTPPPATTTPMADSDEEDNMDDEDDEDEEDEPRTTADGEEEDQDMAERMELEEEQDQPRSRSDIEKALRYAHGERGHFGRDTTLWILRRAGYDWPGMRKDVAEWCKQCDSCIKQRSQVPKLKGDVRDLATTAPHEEWAMDIAGPFDKDGPGHGYCLVVVESFCRFVWLFHLGRRQTASAVTKCIELLIPMTTAPARIRTDNGSVLKAKEFIELCKRYNIKPHPTDAPTRHESNGLAEVYIQHMQKQLRILTERWSDRRNWMKYLPTVATMLNNRPCTSTGYTPTELLFGQGKEELDTLREKIEERVEGVEGRGESADRRAIAMRVWQEHMKGKRERARRKQEGILKKRKQRGPDNPTVLRVGQWVMVRPEKRPATKLTARLGGPYKVVGTKPGNIYVLEDTITTQKTFTMHMERLVQCDMTKFTDPEYHVANDHCIYVVEKILAHREDPKNKRTQFLVKWKYHKETSWEAISPDNLSSRNEKLLLYLREKGLTLRGGSVSAG
jgi:transposase InsO family protein/ribonuclease HI